MTDREMLELAALAAGMEKDARYPGTYYNDKGLPWDPLTDDGDALRLAHAVNAAIQCRDGGEGPEQVGFFSWAEVRIDGRWIRCTELHCSHRSAEAATRLAITRAAAEVGRKMREGKE